MAHVHQRQNEELCFRKQQQSKQKQATVEHSLWPGAICSQFNKPSGWLKHVTLMLKDQELTDQGYF